MHDMVGLCLCLGNMTEAGRLRLTSVVPRCPPPLAPTSSSSSSAVPCALRSPSSSAPTALGKAACKHKRMAHCLIKSTTFICTLIPKGRGPALDLDSGKP